MDTATGLTWVPVSRRWYAHRSEPLLQERLWGCDLPLRDHITVGDGYWDEGARDRTGAAVGWRQRRVGDGGVGRPTELAEWDGTVRTVRLLDGAVVRTVFDGDGRAVRTDYEGVRHFAPGSETYEYDRRGHLVAINEYVGLLQTVSGSMIEPTGGRLVVEHDDDGVCLITDADGDIRWQRPSGDWPAELAAYAERTARDLVAGARAARADASSHRPDDRVVALRLIYTEEGGLDFTPMVSTESELANIGPGPRTEEVDIPKLGDIALLGGGDDLPLDYDGIEADHTMDGVMLRRSCQMDSGEPHGVVLGEVAKRLSVADWTGVFTPADDFVVFIDDHDGTVAAKLRSIRSHNPPERVARWEARRRALGGR